jgi:hypothetical protein
MARKRDDTVKLVLRLPPPLHQQLTRVATRNNQSLNSEMIRRLTDSFLWPASINTVGDAARMIAAGAEQRSREKLLLGAKMLLHLADNFPSKDEGKKK